jgi:isopropylmalate/homocitrate/citramalate synthase
MWNLWNIFLSPRRVGRPGVDVALGKGSGLANIEEHLERRGREATADQANEILARVKQISIEKKSLLTGAEFERLLMLCSTARW